MDGPSILLKWLVLLIIQPQYKQGGGGGVERDKQNNDPIDCGLIIQPSPDYVLIRLAKNTAQYIRAHATFAILHIKYILNSV